MIFQYIYWKKLFLKVFLDSSKRPKFFWRHKEFQKRHFGTKAPLLATLLRMGLGASALKKSNMETRPRIQPNFHDVFYDILYLLLDQCITAVLFYVVH